MPNLASPASRAARRSRLAGPSVTRGGPEARHVQTETGGGRAYHANPALPAPGIGRARAKCQTGPAIPHSFPLVKVAQVHLLGVEPVSGA